MVMVGVHCVVYASRCGSNKDNAWVNLSIAVLESSKAIALDACLQRRSTCANAWSRGRWFPLIVMESPVVVAVIGTCGCWGCGGP